VLPAGAEMAGGATGALPGMLLLLLEIPPLIAEVK